MECDATLSVLEGENVTLPPYSSLSEAWESLEDVPSMWDHVALRHKGTQLSFREVNKFANSTARHILQLIGGVPPGSGQRGSLAQITGILTNLSFTSLGSGGTINGPSSREGQWRGDEKLVAVCMEPSEHLVIVLLAILKLGAAYVPLDPLYPEERYQAIISDCRPLCVVSDSSRASNINHTIQSVAATYPGKLPPVLDFSTVDLMDPLIPNKNLVPGREVFAWREVESSLATVLYTSGSMGKPKPVCLSHKNILNRLNWAWQTFPFRKGEVGCFKTALSFVDSVCEIFSCLLQGITLYILPQGVASNPELLVQALAVNHVSRLVLVPSLLQMILLYVKMNKTAAERLAHIKLWVCSAEKIPIKMSKEFFQLLGQTIKSVTLCNFYGSTELTGDVTYETFVNTEDIDMKVDKCNVPVGIPIYNTNVYLLNPAKELVKLGETGEIYVSGLNVTQTTDPNKFLKNHLIPDNNSSDHQILYRTGDFGRIVKRRLYFEGRTDTEVKVHGRRIDLNEIEGVVSAIQGVAKVVVLCHQMTSRQDDKALVAYYTEISAGSCPQPEFSRMCHAILPPYMVPHIILVPDIPLLISGKVDRESLFFIFQNERYRHEGSETSMSLHVDHSHLCVDCSKDVLLQTVSFVLNVPNSHALLRKNFFEIGGNSINATVTMATLKEHGFEVTFDEFLSAKTLNDIAAALRRLEKSEMVIEFDHGSGINEMKGLTFLELKDLPENRRIISLISTSFALKNPLDQAINNVPENFELLLKRVWPALVEDNLTLVAVDQYGEPVGAMINFDFMNEPELDVPEHNKPIFDMHEELENRCRSKLQAESNNIKWLHQSLMGTADTLTPQQNITVMKKMEEEVVDYARKKGFTGVFTCNSNKLNQELCRRYMGYELMEIVVVQDYVHRGKRVFGHVNRDVMVMAMKKYL